MNEFWDGATVNVAKKAFKGGTTKELGIRFLLYGALAEVFARTTGFNKGLGGSMHTFFTPFGIYPNNAIVGGSGSIAVGAALYKKVNRKPGIVVANLGRRRRWPRSGVGRHDLRRDGPVQAAVVGRV